MMSRRGSPGLQIFIGSAVVLIFLYGFYSYHGIQTRLRNMEEKADRLKVQHESVSAQLQVVYEHKTRLEKAVQEEKTEHKKTKEDLTLEKEAVEEKLRQEKQSLYQDLDRMKGEKERIESLYSKAEVEGQQLKEKMSAAEKDCQKKMDLYQQQLNQQRQECDNDAAQLKDAVADLQRRNKDLEGKIPTTTLSSKFKGRLADKQNKSLQNEEDQNVMQIAEPGLNKRKAYFEVNSPAPVDENAAEAEVNKPIDDKQVAAPVVKHAAEDVKVDAGAVRDDDEDNRIKDVPEQNRGIKKSLDSNIINHLPEESVKEVVKEPEQVPAPVANDRLKAIRRDEHQSINRLDNQVVQVDKRDQLVNPDQMNHPGQVNHPGQLGPLGQNNQPGQVDPPGQALKLDEEDNAGHIPRIAAANADEEQQMAEDQQNPNEPKVDDDDNAYDNGKDM